MKPQITNLLQGDFGVTRLGMDYPPEQDISLFCIPVRKSKRGYQMWNGEKWVALKVRDCAL